MSEPAIIINNISKSYRLGVIGRNTLQDEVRYLWHKLCRRDIKEHMGLVGNGHVPGHAVGPAEENVDKSGLFWALKDVSFSVDRGEVVGVIGRNGAGKSTLLKILSRITEPSGGDAYVNGRVASLLEVGTGFHQELTGRENVYLNGTILGMRKREIDLKFDEIVAFAELETFIDTPVKRYSSGMHVRLAFAVAAHLEPEILLVDEVLAVGDAAFQKKCLGKMTEVADQGRTILFVSHNMSAVNRLCPRSVLLNDGKVEMDAPSIEVTAAYLGGSSDGYQEKIWSDSDAPGRDGLKLLAVKLKKVRGDRSSVFEVKDRLVLEIHYKLERPNMSFRCLSVFYTQGIVAFASVEKEERVRDRPGEYISSVEIPEHLLTEGEYTAGVSIFNTKGIKSHYVKEHDAVQFQVVDKIEGDTARGDYTQNLTGVVRPMLKWSERSKNARY